VVLANTNNKAMQLRFREPDASGDEYSSFQADPQDYDLKYTLPTIVPTLGQGLTVASVLGTSDGGVPVAYDITLEWAPVIGNSGSGPVTGSGVDGRLAWWNSATNVTSDANLYWDDANNRLGIGTETPGASLDVEGHILISNGNTDARELRFAEPNYQVGIGNSQTTAFIAQAQTDNLTYTLPASGPASSANGSNRFAFATNSTGNNATLLWETFWSPQGNAGTTEGTSFLGTTDAQGLSIRTNNSERVRITSTGNVGIGDTDPLALFTVGSGDAFQVNSSGAIAAVTGITTSGGYTQSGTGANTLTGATTINNTLGVTGTTSINTTGTAATNIGTSGATNTILGATNINNSGNGATSIGTGASAGTVTIGRTGGTLTTAGTHSHTGAASVNNNGNFNTSINTGTSTGVVAIGGSASTTNILGVTNINTSGSAATSIGTGATAGTVTIGHTSGTITTAGTLGHTGAANVAGVTSINNNANNNTSINTGTSTGIVAIGGSSSTTTVLGTTNINSTGTASTTIGNTSAPVTIGRLATTLNTSVPGTADRIVLASSNGALDQVSISALVSANGWALTGNDPTESTNFIGTTTNKRLEFRTNGTERMRIASDGNVSIGTLTTSHPLTVAGNATTSTLLGPLYVAGNLDATNNGVSATLDATADGGNIFSMVAGGTSSDVPGGFGIYQSGTAYRMAINSDGEMHVGGLSSTTDHLNFGSMLNVRGNASIGSNYWNDAAPTDGLIVEGNVGIGTIGPVTSKLTIVNGTDGNKGLVVTGSAGQTANLVEIQNSGGTVLVSVGASGALTATAGATISGDVASINANSNFATNINTGTSTGSVNIGNSGSTVTVLGPTNINTTGSENTTIGNSGTVAIVGPTNINTGTSTDKVTIGNSGSEVAVEGKITTTVVLVAAADFDMTAVGNTHYNVVVFQDEAVAATRTLTLPAGTEGRVLIVINEDALESITAGATGRVITAKSSQTFVYAGGAWH